MRQKLTEYEIKGGPGSGPRPGGGSQMVAGAGRVRNATVHRIIHTGENYSSRLNPQHGTSDSQVVEAHVRFDDGTEGSITRGDDEALHTRKPGDRLTLRTEPFNPKRHRVVGKLPF